jgi:hypothetical protein
MRRSEAFGGKTEYSQNELAMRYWIALIVIIWCPCWAGAQADFSGSWSGYLTQGRGGYAPRYDFELYLKQQGRRVTGRSYVRLEGIYAIMELRGEIGEDQVLRFTETRMIDNWKPDDIDWCYKRASLRLTGKGTSRQLEGPWSGFTEQDSECVPGVIVLKKQVPRA